MRDVKKCQECGEYTLKDKHCSEKAKKAGYKYVKVQQESAKKELN